MTTVRILIYTDYEQINENEALFSWGITELRKFIAYKTRALAEFKVDLMYRFRSKLEPQRLTSDYLSQYQQLWVLCFNSVRMPPYELDAVEVVSLKDWMDRGGGLLVAGDHAAGFCDTGNPATFDAHGRSLGEPMKRAGQMRIWHGPPTACTDKPLKDRDNFNTCEGDDPLQLDNIANQSDSKALNLLTLGGSPHQLFWWTKDSLNGVTPIRKFPDHPHESKLVVPENLDGDWPPNSPFPVVVAKARDRRFTNQQRDYALVVVYDGDPVKVGRIVADSSFHHYININLSGVPDRDSNGFPRPKSDLDQIAQFYGNLALWLTPRTLRNEIKLDLFFRLATDPDVFEVRGSGITSLGRVALWALDLRWGGRDLHRLVALSESEVAPRTRLDEMVAAIFVDGDSSKLSVAERTTILGAIVEAHHRFFSASGAVTPDWLQKKPRPLEMVKEGLKLVREMQPSLAERVLPLLERALEDFEANEADY